MKQPAYLSSKHRASPAQPWNLLDGAARYQDRSLLGQAGAMPQMMDKCGKLSYKRLHTNYDASDSLIRLDEAKIRRTSRQGAVQDDSPKLRLTCSEITRGT